MGDITRTSDEQKKLKGQGRYIKNTPATEPIARLWRSPADMKEAAKRFHLRIGRLLVGAKVLTSLDKPTFIRISAIHGRLIDLEQLLATEGETITSGDKTIRNPAAATYKELLPQYIRLAEKFGLTPYDRKRIDLPIDNNPRDKAKEFLGL